MFSFSLLFLRVFTISLPCSIENCETCSQSSESICINCYQGYARSLELGCILQDTSYQSLAYRIENCISYANDLTCSKCQTGYFPVLGRCSPLCPSNCSCFSPFQCLKSSRSLNSCSDSNCLTCCSGVKPCCSQCKPGYSPGLSGLCKRAPCLNDPNCKVCSIDNIICIDCKNGFGYINGACKACSNSACEQCDFNTTACTKCSSGFELVSSSCQVVCSDKNCAKCDENTCKICKSGFYFDLIRNGCAQCPKNCISCNGYKCLVCDSGYKLNHSNNCSAAYNNEISIIKGYFI